MKKLQEHFSINCRHIFLSVQPQTGLRGWSLLVKSIIDSLLTAGYSLISQAFLINLA